MKYLDTFAGIGGFTEAIQSIIPNAECVGYSEIDRFALQCYQSHYSSHKNFGDITQIDISALPEFDLLVGGFPCQDLSIAKKNREGLQGKRSGLFFNLLEILKAKKPKFFIFENVNSMHKECKLQITNCIKEIYPDVQMIMIDAARVSAQSRKRIFWTNFPVTQPEDRHIFLKDILEPEVDEKYFLKQQSIDKIKFLKGKKDLIRNKDGFEYHFKEGEMPLIQGAQAKPLPILASTQSIGRATNYIQWDASGKGYNSQQDRAYPVDGKSPPVIASIKMNIFMPDKSYPIDANYQKGTDVEGNLQRHKRQIVSGCAFRTRTYANQEGQIEERKDGKANSLTSIPKDSMVNNELRIRRLTPTECERLQNFPDGYTKMLSDSQRYRCLGNAVNVRVVEHIIRCMLK